MHRRQPHAAVGMYSACLEGIPGHPMLLNNRWGCGRVWGCIWVCVWGCLPCFPQLHASHTAPPSPQPPHALNNHHNHPLYPHHHDHHDHHTPPTPPTPTHRAAAYLHRNYAGDAFSALMDAEDAIDAAPGYFRPYIKRAQALRGLGMVAR